MSISSTKHELCDYLDNKRFDSKKYYEILKTRVDVPVKYTRLDAYMAFFPVSYKEAYDLIGVKKIYPVSILNAKTLLALTIFDYAKCQVGPYREIALSIPVRIDPILNVPILPLIFDDLFNDYGFYTILLAMSTELARDHSKVIFGFPTYKNTLDIQIEDCKNFAFIKINDNNSPVLSLKIKFSTKINTIEKTFRTYFKANNNQISVVSLNAKAAESRLRKNNLGKLELGNHHIAEIIKTLIPTLEPIQTVRYSNAAEVLDEPIILKL